MIVDNIRALCEKNGTSIWAIERALGIGNGIIARWATSSPRVENLKLVADYFGVTIDELLKEGRLCTATTTESSSASATESC